MPHMPVVFIGHGSPMNAIEDTPFARAWTALGTQLPRPTAIVTISAHWYIEGTHVTANDHPETIHDFYGFPDELYAQRYPAPGDPKLAKHLVKQFADIPIELDQKWGLDHGTWSVTSRLFPQADIPIIQLSVDGTKSGEWHYELGTKLRALREQGILLLGSGNIVHHLGRINFSDDAVPHAWATEFDKTVREHIIRRDDAPLCRAGDMSAAAKLSIPTPDHYFPLLTILGAADHDDRVTLICPGEIVYGSISMTSCVLGDLAT